LPVRVNKESENNKYVAGRKTMPTHFNLSHHSVMKGLLEVPPIASEVYITPTKNRIRINALATRSFKLNADAYRNREKAVIATPAVKI
jgi:hypothetical protein